MLGCLVMGVSGFSRGTCVCFVVVEEGQLALDAQSKSIVSVDDEAPWKISFHSEQEVSAAHIILVFT